MRVRIKCAVAIVQVQFEARGNLKRTISENFDAFGMALWRDRMALSNARDHTISVFDLEGVHLYTFGEMGWLPGQFCMPKRLCAHPNGNLLVAESEMPPCGRRRIQEVTWTGDHVRFVYTATAAGAEKDWRYTLEMDVCQNGALIAVYADHELHEPDNGTIDVLDGITCALLRRIPVEHRCHDIRFNPDGSQIFVGGLCEGDDALAFRVFGDGGCVRASSTLFSSSMDYMCVEFTGGGDVVLCARKAGPTVYCGKTFEPLRNWGWGEGGRPGLIGDIIAVQVHRGLLYVAAMGNESSAIYVYE